MSKMSWIPAVGGENEKLCALSRELKCVSVRVHVNVCVCVYVYSSVCVCERERERDLRRYRREFVIRKIERSERGEGGEGGREGSERVLLSDECLERMEFEQLRGGRGRGRGRER